MAITLPEDFSKTSHKENWLVQLYYGDESNFTGIAFADTEVGISAWENASEKYEEIDDHWNNVDIATTSGSNFYHGVITSTSGVRDSFDLEKQTASTSNMSFTIANFKLNGTNFSEQILNGSNNYINRKVDVYFQPDDVDSIGKCVRIFTGRLTDFNHNESTINLTITTRRPYDNLTYPNVRSANGNYFPIAFGDYTASSSTYASPEYADNLSKAVHPVPVDQTTKYFFFCLNHENTGSTDSTLYYYDNSLDAFLPVEDSNDAEAYSNGFALKTRTHLKRHFKFKPYNIILRLFDGDNAIDGTTDQDSSGTFGTLELGGSDISDSSSPFNIQVNKDQTFNLRAFDDLPALSSSFSSNNHGLTFTFVWRMTNFYATSSGDFEFNNLKVFDISEGTSTELDEYEGADIPGTNSASGIDIGEQVGTSNRATDYINNGGYPDGFKMRVQRNAVADNNVTLPLGTSSKNVLKFYDMRFTATTAIDTKNDKTDGNARISEIKQLYSGHDGFSKSYSGGSGTASTGLEAHREIIKKTMGIDDVDENIYNWSDVYADRVTSAWNIRYWELEPRPVIDILEQIQQEFCFIFKFRVHDNSLAYYHIKDSYSSGDVTTTLSADDIADIEINNTSFDKLLTSVVVNSEKHPAKNVYMSTDSDSNSAARTKYNIATNENIKEFNLDMLVNKANVNLDDNPNDGFQSYMGNLFLDVKLEISCKIVNNQKGYLLETGDIVQFDSSNMPVKAFADNWSKYFMIIKTNRGVGSNSIVAREVG